MRQGGLNSGFAQQVDATNGRVDITFTRSGDTTGASGGGLLAAIIFDPAAAGSSTLAISGAAAGPSGGAIHVGDSTGGAPIPRAAPAEPPMRHGRAAPRPSRRPTPS